MEYLNEQTKLEHPECRCDTPNNIGASNIRPNTPDPNIACPTPICPNPMRLWVIKYAITGTAKFIGQAVVQAPTIEQAQCIFGKDSRFNGYVDRLKITCCHELFPHPEPILLMEDCVAIIDRRNLKTYPFVLKSDFSQTISDLYANIAKAIRDSWERYRREFKAEIYNGLQGDNYINIEVTEDFEQCYITHANSGVTAGEYGDILEEQQESKTPDFGESVKIMSLTVDSQGHITEIEDHLVTIPDTEATQLLHGLMSATDKKKLDEIGINTNNSTALTPANELFNNVINLHKIAKTGTFSDLLAIPNGKLTIQKNGTTIDEFVDNADTDKTINVVVNDGQLDIKYNNQSLGTFTADQETDTNVSLPLIKHKGTLITLDNNNSLNIPTEIDDALTTANDKTWSIDKIKTSMPTVNNATLLIQKNGTNVESFTANDSTNKIANIIVPTKTSDLTNDGEGDVEEISGQMVPLKYITRLANNLQYYYTKTEIDTLIAPNLRYEIVQTLPTQNISPTTIYLLPNGSSDTTNYYDEYLYIATASTPYWECIGSTRVDLTPYQTKTLSTPIVVDGVSQTTVEAVLSALNTLLNNHTHSWSSITNKPTIPTVNNATLTIQKNGTTVNSFTANASSDVTCNITVPTKTSDLDNDSGYITSASLPTVNNATLTIQKNGTNVQTFTANASSNKTANIIVPTKVSELTNDSGYTTNIGTVTQVKVGSTAYNPTSGVISLPAYPTDTNTHRPIQMNGTEILGNNTTALNLKAGSNVTLSSSGGTITINAASDTDTGATSVETTGSGNAVTTASYSAANRKITLTKGITTLVAGTEGETAITDNSDLNDYTKIGTYGTAGGHGGSTTAASLINKPTFSGGFRMYVESCGGDGSYIRQTIITKAGLTFVRTGNLNNSTWNTWEQIRGLNYGSSTTTFLRNDGTWATPADTNTHRPIQMNGTEILGNNITALNLKAGSNVSLSNSNGNVTINATDTNTTYTLSADTTNNKITLTPSSGSAQSITVPYATSAGSATSATSATTATTATKLGSETVGGASKAIYLNAGTPTAGNSFVPTTGGTFNAANGTAGTEAYTTIIIGNSTGTATAKNSTGQIRLYGSASTSATTAYYTQLRPGANTANRTITFPNAGGTVALTTSNITGTAANVTGTVAIANGGTGATTAADARTNLGIGNVGTLNYASNTTKYLRNDGTWQVPYSAATQSAAGLMSAADKTKLDGVSSNVSSRWTATINNTSYTTFLTFGCNGFGSVCCCWVEFTAASSVSASETTTILTITKPGGIGTSHNLHFLVSNDNGSGGCILLVEYVANQTSINIKLYRGALASGTRYTGSFSFITA